MCVLQPKRPKWDLDVQDPILTEADIPFKLLDFSNEASWTVEILKNWLKGRGLRQKGLKEQLVQR